MISYQNNINGTINNIYLCGIKFKIDGIKEAKDDLVKAISEIEEYITKPYNEQQSCC